MNQVIFQQLSQDIHQWGADLGFQQVGITDTDLSKHQAHLEHWLGKNYHGTMHYMSRHGAKRSQPQKLIQHTLRIISLRMDYLPANTAPLDILASDNAAYIARYSLGRDYHKVMRKRLAKLWQYIADFLEDQQLEDYTGRVFTDSAPVLEKAIAEKAGLGWIGKNTLLMSQQAGSWFFLGEIYTDLPLIIDESQAENHCGSCTACLEVCPTGAIVAPYQLDARKCISYLTIEHRGSIDEPLRKLIGNRIFGCDDCQLFCPWNKFANYSREADFSPRHHLDHSALIDLFNWTEAEFLQRTTGSAIRRVGYIGWLRNIAIALGNAPYAREILLALEARKQGTNELLLEHIQWALTQQEKKQSLVPNPDSDAQADD